MKAIRITSANREEFARSVTVDADAKTVRRVHVTKHGDGSNAAHYGLTWTFDFSGVSQEQLMELASRSVLISYRPTFQKVPANEVDQWADLRISVADFLTRGRAPVDPKARIRSDLSKLSAEERAAILAELSAS